MEAIPTDYMGYIGPTLGYAQKIIRNGGHSNDYLGHTRPTLGYAQKIISYTRKTLIIYFTHHQA